MYTSEIEKFYKEMCDNIKKSVPATIIKTGKCTCGVKFTGGICSDWCDTNHPVEDTEELPF